MSTGKLLATHQIVTNHFSFSSFFSSRGGMNMKCNNHREMGIAECIKVNTIASRGDASEATRIHSLIHAIQWQHSHTHSQTHTHYLMCTVSQERERKRRRNSPRCISFTARCKCYLQEGERGINWRNCICIAGEANSSHSADGQVALCVHSQGELLQVVPRTKKETQEALMRREKERKKKDASVEQWKQEGMQGRFSRRPDPTAYSMSQ